MATASISLIDKYVTARFWSSTEVSRPDHCWNWRGGKCGQGYGQFGLGKRHYKAHQIALLIDGQERPSEDHGALHSCDNPSCVNPNHLRWGTQLENARDREVRDRGNRSKGAGLTYKIKLTAQQAREIAHSSEKGTVLASRYGISTTLVCAIRKRRVWQHVT